MFVGHTLPRGFVPRGTCRDVKTQRLCFRGHLRGLYHRGVHVPHERSIPFIGSDELGCQDIEVGDAKVGVHTSTDNLDSLQAYGTGIWGTSDSFNFHQDQRPIADGAFDVIAYTEEFHTGYAKAKGGIMIRDSSDADAAHAFVGMSGYYNGVTFITRDNAGGITKHHKTVSVPHHKAQGLDSSFQAGQQRGDPRVLQN